MLTPPRGVPALLADAFVAVMDTDGLVLGSAESAHELAPVVLAHQSPAFNTIT